MILLCTVYHLMGLNYPKIRIVGIFLLFSSRHNVTSSPVERVPNVTQDCGHNVGLSAL